MSLWRGAAASVLCAGAGVFRSLSRALHWTAVGLCDRETFLRRNRSAWSGVPDYTEREVLDAGLSPAEEARLAALRPGGRVAVVGCGGGRDLLALARKGFNVAGLDVSAEAVACANAELARAGLPRAAHCGDAADFEFPDGPYDAFVFSWYAYGFIPGRDRRVRALGHCVRRLAEGGTLILTVHAVPRHERSKAAALAGAVAALTLNRDRLEPGDAVADNFFFEHQFTREEVESEAREAGLALVDWIREDIPGCDVAAVLRRAEGRRA